MACPDQPPRRHDRSQRIGRQQSRMGAPLRAERTDPRQAASSTATDDRAPTLPSARHPRREVRSLSSQASVQPSSLRRPSPAQTTQSTPRSLFGHRAPRSYRRRDIEMSPMSSSGTRAGRITKALVRSSTWVRPQICARWVVRGGVFSFVCKQEFRQSRAPRPDRQRGRVDEGGRSPTRARARCACRSSRIRPAASTPATPAVATKEGSRCGRSRRRTVEGMEMRTFGECQGTGTTAARALLFGRCATSAIPDWGSARRCAVCSCWSSLGEQALLNLSQCLMPSRLGST